MPKYKVNAPFYDKANKKYVDKGNELDLSEIRASEINQILKSYAAEKEITEVLTLVDEKSTKEPGQEESVTDVTKLSKEDLQSKLDELGVKYKAADNKAELLALLEAATQKEGE
ncbi:TPA: hypothetical protein VB825_000671 [Streptococcus suis]|nr:hypothetical protein [Streptococcus suis]